ncbi:hypothetical protein [Aquimarina aquimarini]|uniref:hypothetical protein n=1 Tax=Aquimarina aquimarini TaxID=1191734 RepID=UPI000D55DF11|nr:hypothetical protein [Aquimarina aquimarini]
MKLIFKIRSITLFILTIFSLLNCSGQADLHKKDYELVNLTNYQNKLVVYDHCNANVETITIKKDSLLINTHQDGVYRKKILSRIRLNNNEFLITYNLTENNPDTVHLKKKNQLWDIDGGLYTEKRLVENYEYIEQPCIECFSKEECDGFLKKETNEMTTKLNSKKVISNTVKYKNTNATLVVENKWNGTYYFNGGEFNLDYIVSVSSDDIKLTTQARQYGYTDQLKAVVNGDTLGLFHHKNISGMNYDDSRSYDFLKFYKSSDGKFYFEGKLPYLPEGAIEFEKVK